MVGLKNSANVTSSQTTRMVKHFINLITNVSLTTTSMIKIAYKEIEPQTLAASQMSHHLQHVINQRTNKLTQTYSMSLKQSLSIDVQCHSLYNGNTRYPNCSEKKPEAQLLNKTNEIL